MGYVTNRIVWLLWEPSDKSVLVNIVLPRWQHVLVMIELGLCMMSEVGLYAYHVLEE